MVDLDEAGRTNAAYFAAIVQEADAWRAEFLVWLEQQRQRGERQANPALSDEPQE